MIKGSLIGLGKMGISHTAIAESNPNIELVSICDSSQFTLSAFSRFKTINVYSNYKEMIDKEDLDFVIVATPTKTHYHIVKYALENGLHVFCEKPFCLSADQGKELVELAKLKELVNQVGYHNNFIGTFIELKRLLTQSIIGDLVHFSGEAYGPVVVRPLTGTWRNKSNEGGGCLYDYASHVINLIQEIICRPEKILGSLLKKIYSKDVEDAVYALIKLQNGTTGTLLVNWSDETYRKMSTSLTIQGSKGKIICNATELKIYLKEEVKSENLDKGWTIKYLTDLVKPVNYYLRGEEYSAQIDHFIDCVIYNKSDHINSFEQAQYTDSVIEMIFKNT